MGNANDRGVLTPSSPQLSPTLESYHLLPTSFEQFPNNFTLTSPSALPRMLYVTKSPHPKNTMLDQNDPQDNVLYFENVFQTLI